MKIALYAKNVRKEQAGLYKNIFSLLSEMKVDYVIYESLAGSSLKSFAGPGMKESFRNYEDLKEKPVDFFISIGGDGTFLDSVVMVKDLGIPVLGINTGRLGFLSNNSPENIRQVFDDLVGMNYHLDNRSVICVEANCGTDSERTFALNDFTIHKRDNSSLAAITTYLNGVFFNTYWGDGIIISTPTGSTAYSMSCGGPVVFPDSDNFIITPVAPHNLNVRPVIVPDNTAISFEIKAREKKFLISFDSRSKVIDQNCEIKICKAGFKLKTVRFRNQSFDSILREKLNWGADNRNN